MHNKSGVAACRWRLGASEVHTPAVDNILLGYSAALLDVITQLLDHGFQYRNDGFHMFHVVLVAKPG